MTEVCDMPVPVEGLWMSLNPVISDGALVVKLLFQVNGQGGGGAHTGYR